jgi:hypothetical protein
MNEDLSGQKLHGVAMSAIALTLGVPVCAGTTAEFVAGASK